MAGDIKLKYGTDAAITMTGIEDIDSSATWITGWTCNAIDNTSVLALDYLVSGQFTSEGAGVTRQAGYIYVYAYGAFDDAPTWPALFSAGTAGSVGAVSCHSAEARDSGMRLVAALYCNATNSAVFTFPPTSIAAVFGGSLPNRFALYVASNIATSTSDWCVASGTALYYCPVLAQYT